MKKHSGFKFLSMIKTIDYFDQKTMIKTSIKMVQKSEK